MELLKTKLMQQPTSWWQPIAEWAAANAPIFAGLGIVWKIVDRTFKYLSEARDERINTLIDQKLTTRITPEIHKLSNSIDELKEAIWEMKK